MNITVGAFTKNHFYFLNSKKTLLVYRAEMKFLSTKFRIFVAESLFIGLAVLAAVESNEEDCSGFPCEGRLCCFSDYSYCCTEQFLFAFRTFCSPTKIEKELVTCEAGSVLAANQARDSHKHVMSEISMAMEFAQKSEENAFAEECLKAINDITPDSEVNKK